MAETKKKKKNKETAIVQCERVQISKRSTQSDLVQRTSPRGARGIFRKYGECRTNERIETNVSIAIRMSGWLDNY